MDNMENKVVEQATNNENGNDVHEPEQADQEKKYTDNDVDRIVSKRLNRERERFQKMFQSEQEENELDEREKKIAIREMKADAREELEKRGLPAKLVDTLNFSDRETMEQGIESLEHSFREAVAFGVKDALKGSTPRKGSASISIEAEKALHDAFMAR